VTVRRCDQCGVEYEAARRTSRYCSSSCRVHAYQGAPARKSRAKPAGDVPTGLMASTLQELVSAGRESTALGQAALLLAYRIERSQMDTGAGVASLVKQHGATLAEALKGATQAKSGLDELRSRRDAKRAG
jgi:hypothetical protein